MALVSAGGRRKSVVEDAPGLDAAAALARTVWCPAERIVGEEPEGVLGVGIAGGRALFGPVDGAEDDEMVRAVQVHPEQAAGRAEVHDAAGDGEVAVVVGEDLVGNGEVIERGVGERAPASSDGLSPEGLRSGEELLEEGVEAQVLDEVVLAAVLCASSGVYCQIHSTFCCGLGGLASMRGHEREQQRRA